MFYKIVQDHSSSANPRCRDENFEQIQLASGQMTAILQALRHRVRVQIPFKELLPLQPDLPPIRNLLDAVARGRDPLLSRQASEETADDELATWFALDSEGHPVFVASRSDEVNLKELSAEERKLFEQSDAIEWEAILKTRAVRVLREQGSRRCPASLS